MPKEKSESPKNSERLVSVLRDVTGIILGKNKDGSPRSLLDAKLELEKQKRKTLKKQRKRL